MKELFVEKVVEESTSFLDNNQRIKLKEILTEICIYYRIDIINVKCYNRGALKN